MFQRPFLLIYGFILGTVLLAACGAPATPAPPPSRPSPSPNLVHLAAGSWPPYDGADLPHYGCDASVVSEAFALQGIPVEYDFFPWARSYSLASAGKWDGTLTWADTPEHRSQHYLSAEPISTQEWVFFFRADRPFEWQSMDDLAGKTIGVTAGYVYSDVFNKIRQDGSANFVESSSDEANFKMLLAGRIDLFPVERQVGQFIIQSIFTPQEQTKISSSTRPFSQFLSYLLLSRAVPESEQRMLLFDRGFQQLKKSGRYAEIMQGCAP